MPLGLIAVPLGSIAVAIDTKIRLGSLLFSVQMT